MAGTIRGLGQVALPATDIERAVTFYRDVLGLAFIWSNTHMAFFQCGETRLLVEIPEDSEFAHSSILYFDVADIDAAVTELKGNGLVFEDEPHHIGDLGDASVWMAFFRDSEGNFLGLQCQRPLA